MVDFNIHYRGDVIEKRGEPCFGSLYGETDRWGKEEQPCEYIEYLPKHITTTLLDERIDWYKNLRLFGIPVENVSILPSKRLSILVRCDVPADLMMASLSVARVLFGENRQDESRAIMNYFRVTGDMNLSFAMGEMSQTPCDKALMFQRRDESIVPDFTLAEYLKWLKDPTCNGTGIERDYAKRKSFTSVKTALTGKELDKYSYPRVSVNKVQFMDFIKYEGEL